MMSRPGLPIAIEIARRTRRIVWQNIMFALGIKAVFLLLGRVPVSPRCGRLYSPDVGVTLLAVLNAMRVLRFDSARMNKARYTHHTEQHPSTV